MGDRTNLSAGSGIGERVMSSDVDSAQSTHPRPNPQNPDDVTRKEWSSLMKTYGQECHHVRREKKRKSAPPDNHRQKNAQPNDPRNDPKKKPRMEGRRRDGMDEQRKPPPKR